MYQHTPNGVEGHTVYEHTVEGHIVYQHTVEGHTVYQRPHGGEQGHNVPAPTQR